MVKVIGFNSREVYVTGETRAEVLRQLQKEFPNTPKNSNGRLYPEPLQIID